jgi:hypothetical protein
VWVELARLREQVTRRAGVAAAPERGERLGVDQARGAIVMVGDEQLVELVVELERNSQSVCR